MSKVRALCVFVYVCECACAPAAIGKFEISNQNGEKTVSKVRALCVFVYVCECACAPAAIDKVGVFRSWHGMCVCVCASVCMLVCVCVHCDPLYRSHIATHSNTQQHTATHCNTLHDDVDCSYYFKKRILVSLIEGLCSSEFSVCTSFAFLFRKKKNVKEKKQIVQDSIPPPSIYIHMCTLTVNLYTYTNTYMHRLNPFGFFGPSRCLVLTPGLTSRSLTHSCVPCMP